MNKNRFDQAITLASRFLEGTGADVLDQTWTCTSGQLDLVARDGRTAGADRWGT
jgi:Holliday junction resolvase-like predicted endonuclease